MYRLGGMPPPTAGSVVARLVIVICGLVFVSLLIVNLGNLDYFSDSYRDVARRLVVPAAVAAAAFAALRLPRSARRMLALGLVSAVAGLYAAELYFGFVDPRCGPCATGRGEVRFDGRGKIEVISDLRARGIEAYPATRAKNLLVPGAGGGLEPVLAGADGGLLPLASLPGKTVVACNENGQWMIYRADEHGFHNPPGLWTGRSPRIVLIGDSFVQGNCVASEDNIAGWLRKDGAEVLNLGVDGSGPLAKLAIFREYVEALRPETVVWFYYEGNDLTKDLSLEMRSAMLRAYARDDGFRQNLAERREEVATGLKTYLDRHMREAIARVDHPWERLVAALKLALVRGRLGLGRVSLGLIDGATEEQFALFGRILSSAARRVGSWGGRMVFVYLPESDRYFGSERNGRIRARIRRRVLATAEALGLPIVDVGDAFARVSDPRRLFTYPGSHYNAEGYELTARAVRDALATPAPTARRTSRREPRRYRHRSYLASAPPPA